MSCYSERRCFECRHFFEHATEPATEYDPRGPGPVVANGIGSCRESPPDQPQMVWSQYGQTTIMGYRRLDTETPACSRFEERPRV